MTIYKRPAHVPTVFIDWNLVKKAGVNGRLTSMADVSAEPVAAVLR